MATIEPGVAYFLSNALTGPTFALASTQDNSNVFIENADPLHNTDRQQWYLTCTDLPNYYRLHTVATGDNIALDVINDNGVDSVNVQLATVGEFTGQYWQWNIWADGTVYLSNNFTGIDKHLDTHSDTLALFLGDGDGTGQHWTFDSLHALGSGPSSCPVVSPTDTPTSTPSDSSPSDTPTSSPPDISSSDTPTSTPLDTSSSATPTSTPPDSTSSTSESSTSSSPGTTTPTSSRISTYSSSEATSSTPPTSSTHSSSSRTITPAAVVPTTLQTTGNIQNAALSELQSLVPVTAQQDSAAACFLLTSYSTCYTTPTWYTSLDSGAQSYFSSVNAANTAACTSCASSTSHSDHLSAGAKAGIGVGAAAGAVALIGIIFGILKCMGIIGSGAGAGSAAWTGVAGAGAAGGAAAGAGAGNAAGGWNGVSGDPSNGAHGWNGVAGDPSSGAGWNGVAGGGGGGGSAAPLMTEQVPFLAAGGYYRRKSDDQPNVAYQRYPPPQQPLMQRPGFSSNRLGSQEIDGTGLAYQQPRSPSEMGGRPISTNAQSELESRPGGMRTTSELSGDTVHDPPSEMYGSPGHASPVRQPSAGERERLQVRNP